jgi:hypothetical protein
MEYKAAKIRQNIISFKKKLRNIIESQLEVVDEIEVLDIKTNDGDEVL